MTSSKTVLRPEIGADVRRLYRSYGSSLWGGLHSYRVALVRREWRSEIQTCACLRLQPCIIKK